MTAHPLLVTVVTPALAMACAALVGCAVPLPVSGFRPISPEVTGSIKLKPGSDLFDWPVVESIRPTLRWKPFPGEHAPMGPLGLGAPVPFISEDADKVKDIRYDLRIWTVDNKMPAELAYAIDGLTEPQHKITQDLQVDTRYYWSVRARYSLNGQTRVSEWSLIQGGPCGEPYPVCGREQARRLGRIPPDNHYRFQTPR